jgi:hypothetical protein
MPVNKGRDKIGHYYRWGNLKKYYYSPEDLYSQNMAYYGALRQGQAIHASKGRRSLR